MEEPQPILENLWWVIPGKLAGVRKPTPEEIAQLKAAGIGAIVSVMDDSSFPGSTNGTSNGGSASLLVQDLSLISCVSSDDSIS